MLTFYDSPPREAHDLLLADVIGCAKPRLVSE